MALWCGVGLSTNRPEPNRFELSSGFLEVRLGSVRLFQIFYYINSGPGSNRFELVRGFGRFDSVRFAKIPVRDSPTTLGMYKRNIGSVYTV